MNEHDIKKDPVCDMKVDNTHLHTEYMGSDFYFCSVQCLERFTANPHLYIGQGGIPSPKQQGVRVIKKRTISLGEIPNDEVQQKLATELLQMMGIIQIELDDDLIHIQYDLLEATASQIEQAIEQSGTALGHVWSDRLKRAFVHYVEETQLENLEHQHEMHGCHRK